MAESFDVFLSHNSKDKPAVRELAVALRERGLKVWLDEWELVPGRPWLELLEKVIESIGCAAVLVGRDGLGPWEAPEMRACLSEFIGRSLPVIPVLLPGAPEKPNLPLLLRQFTWVDLRNGLTPEGLNRLEWGITGKRPEVRQEVTAAPPGVVGWVARPGSPAKSPDQEVLHEQARRLARLLVSEIKIYNLEQIEEGRKSKDLYVRLKDDIDRSRRMYEERIEPSILESTAYFYQELVRILADGDAKALGI